MAQTDERCRVEALYRYPVKSLQGERLERAEIGVLGIVGDRAWGVLDRTTGKVLSAKREGRLLMAAARLDGEPSPRVEVPGGATLGGWLGRDVEVVPAPKGVRTTYENLDDPFDEQGPAHDYQGPIGTFHDDQPVHLVTTASLRAASQGHQGGDWDPRRFRPNVVLGARGEGFVEDGWLGRRLRMGTVLGEVAKTTSRCVVVTRPQPDGIRHDRQVLASLGRGHDWRLGVYLRVISPGEVAVGDEATLLPG